MEDQDHDRFKVVRTILEMLRDRDYTFDPRNDPEKLLAGLNDTTAQEIPFVNMKVTDASVLPLDKKGIPVYVYIQEGDENLETFGDNQPDRMALAKKIVYQLRTAFPDLGNSKKINDIYEKIHLILVLNVIKREMIRFEEEALNIYSLEVWPKYRLRYNVSKHELVGTYTRLTPEQFEKHKNDQQVTALTMKKVLLDDPPIRYYYGQAGEAFHHEGLRGHQSFRLVIKKTIHSHNKKK